MVHKFIRKLIVSASLLIFSATAFAELVVIVHPSNDSALDAKKVQRIFLGKEKKFSNGSAVVPLNQVTNDLRNQFDSNVLGRSSTQVSAYWSKLVFTGKGIPPKELANDAAVVAAVAADAGAIGYVDSASVTGDVKTVSVN